MTTEPKPGETWVTDHGVRMKMPRPGSRFAYVRLDYRVGGRRRQPTFGADWRAAWTEAWRVDALLAAEQGDTSGITVTALAAAWQDACGPDWSDRYREDNADTLAGDVLPLIGSVRLGELSRAHARDCINAQPSKSGRKRVRALLSSMYGWGIDEQWLTAELKTILPPVGKDAKGNKLQYVKRESAPAPADVVTLYRQMLQPRVYESKHARKQFTPPTHWALMMAVAGFLGLRQGEVWGMRGSDVNGSTLHVRRQAQRVKRRLSFPPPKYGSVRDVFIPTDVLGVPLRRLLEARAAEVGPDGLMFPTSTGRVWTRSNFYRDVVAHARPLAWPGKAWTFHDLRHTACRKWLDDGVAIADVTRLAGHSGVDVTLKLYISPNDGVTDRVAAVYGE